MKTLGQIAFEAYKKFVQDQTYDEKPIPAWNELTDKVRGAWDAAAIAVTQEGNAYGRSNSEGAKVAK